MVITDRGELDFLIYRKERKKSKKYQKKKNVYFQWYPSSDNSESIGVWHLPIILSDVQKIFSIVNELNKVYLMLVENYFCIKKKDTHTQYRKKQ